MYGRRAAHLLPSRRRLRFCLPRPGRAGEPPTHLRLGSGSSCCLSPVQQARLLRRVCAYVVRLRLARISSPPSGRAARARRGWSGAGGQSAPRRPPAIVAGADTRAAGVHTCASSAGWRRAPAGLLGNEPAGPRPSPPLPSLQAKKGPKQQQAERRRRQRAKGSGRRPPPQSHPSSRIREERGDNRSEERRKRPYAGWLNVGRSGRRLILLHIPFHWRTLNRRCWGRTSLILLIDWQHGLCHPAFPGTTMCHLERQGRARPLS